ncbi:MAG: cobalamin-binding protein [Proteobacteria bacterium]|nr:cobalamin-binding protein [Pseudomonadota bacterium]
MKESLQKVITTLVDLDYDACFEAISQSLEAGASAWEIVNDGLGVGMKEIGDLFEKGEYFLGDLVMAGNIMTDATELLKDKLGEDRQTTKGTVILATVKGDMHDLGKNIVGMMLKASGFEIVDLGVDVDADKILKSVKETKAGAIGLTMLLTTSIAAMQEIGTALKEAGLRDQVKVAIGGASTNQKLADQLGFDAYGENAAQAVGIFENLLGVS